MNYYALRLKLYEEIDKEILQMKKGDQINISAAILRYTKLHPKLSTKLIENRFLLTCEAYPRVYKYTLVEEVPHIERISEENPYD